MKKFEEVLAKYVNLPSEHVRKIGVYWASDIYRMITGELTPKNFFEEPYFYPKTAKSIVTGEALEEKINKVFEATDVDYQYQPRREIALTAQTGKTIDKITLVVKPDFLFKDFVLETKFSSYGKVNPNKIPDWYIYQLEAEYRAFFLPVYLGMITVPLDLQLVLYIPDKKIWEKAVAAITDFHIELKKLKVQNGNSPSSLGN